MKIIINIWLLMLITINLTACSSEKGKTEMKYNENGKKANHLIGEKSPYLLQHAYNPVNWYPWSEEAFERAKKENKAIFLSIGYSTCHWCHVMEHESFEDSSVAELMNKYFVSIKVDREERPDIDNIYMTVCQMLTGSGGWPLTIIMTPDKKPFYAATYIPKETKFGRMGLMELLPKVADVWQNERDKIEGSASQITNKLKSISVNAGDASIDKSIFGDAYGILNSRFDNDNGGFGEAPKFPTAQNLLFLLRYWNSSKESRALEMVETTLTKMRQGGIFDQIGFGFHRYSTDNQWLLPHFEKMLYDQAMLAMAYTETYQATGKILYKETAEQIFNYVLRDMTSPEGGFYSAEDADSDGEEGKFYVWSLDELESNLNKNDSEFFIDVFNISRSGNFKDQAKGIFTGTNIPHLTGSISEIAKKYKSSNIEIEKRIESIRKVLFNIREKRIHPFKDDKILTDWNGLMIAAFAKAGRVFNNNKFKNAAENAANFIFNHLSENERLLHRYRNGESIIKGNLDDYSFFVMGLIELYETTFNPVYLKKAVSYMDAMLSHFWDEKDGGFYFTSNDAEKLLMRSKEVYDAAIPSGNSVAFLDLIKLGRITSNTKYEDYASKLLKSFSTNIERSPTGVSFLLTGIQFEMNESYEIVIAGEQGDSNYAEMLSALNANYIPNKVVVGLRNDNRTDITSLAPFTKNYSNISGKTVVYVCKNYVCSLPVDNAKSLDKLLEN